MPKIMRACSTASGGVMFIPDEIERKQVKQETVSYRDLVGEDAAAKTTEKAGFRLFGFLKPRTKDKQKVAA